MGVPSRDSEKSQKRQARAVDGPRRRFRLVQGLAEAGQCQPGVKVESVLCHQKTGRWPLADPWFSLVGS